MHFYNCYSSNKKISDGKIIFLNSDWQDTFILILSGIMIR